MSDVVFDPPLDAAEQAAWDRYAAVLSSCSDSAAADQVVQLAAETADHLILERRARFGDGRP